MLGKFILWSTLFAVAVGTTGCGDIQDVIQRSKATRGKRKPVVRAPGVPTDISVGSKGALVSLDSNWTRKRFDPNMGKDQFMRTDGGVPTYLVVFEVDMLLECEEDFDWALDEGGLIVSLPGEVLHKDGLVFRRQGETGHARLRKKATVTGMRLAYDVNLLGQGDLGYMFLFWTTRAHAPMLKSEVDQIIPTFRFPDEDSEWAQARQPQIETVMQDGNTIQFKIDKSLFETDPNSGEPIYSVMTPNTRIQKMLFNLSNVDNRQEAFGLLWDYSLELYQQDGRSPKEIERRDGTVAGMPAHQGILDLDNGESTQVETVVEMGPGQFLGIRYFAKGPRDVRLARHDAWLETFTIQMSPQLDAYPIVEAKQQRSWASESLLRLLQKASMWPRLTENVVVARLMRDGRILGVAADGVFTLDKDGNGAESLTSISENHWSRTAVFVGDDLLYTVDGEGVAVVRSGAGVSEPTVIQASILAPYREKEFLIGRTASGASLVGTDSAPQSLKSEVFLRAGLAGEERRVAQIAGRQLTHLSVDGAGRLILAASHTPFDSTMDEDERIRLSFIDPEKGIVGETEEFGSVSKVGPAPDGWVVLGDSVEQGTILALVNASGNVERLATGSDLVPVEIRDDQLVFACSTTIAPPYDGWQQFYSVDLEIVKEVGAKLGPFTAEGISSIAADAFEAEELALGGEPILTTRADVERFLKAADEAAVAAVGVSLPAESEAVDNLINSFSGTEKVTSEGVVLLASLLARALLKDGAEWVEGDSADIGRPGFDEIPSNDWAVGASPVRLVINTLYADWWNPAQNAISFADGRTMFVGNSSQAVAAKVTEARRKNVTLEQLAKRPTNEIREVLIAQRKNLHVRRGVYRLLAFQKRMSDLVELTAGFLVEESPAYLDYQFDLAARLATMKSGDPQWMALGEDLKEAIRQFPSEAATFVMLGRYYERSDMDNARQLAAACYNKSLELKSWGAIAEQAEEALESLEAE